ncbi:TolB family protein, partial [Paraglaciecola sp.]|uniref:TolB family protein n=1 Tax=Paraglaciecola sp. TaxID=1920173 RepID=UPI003EF33032
ATSGTFNKKPDISENGNLLVSERYDEGRSSIWLYDLNTDSEKKLFPNSFENFNSPTISNDNAKLAYMRSHRDPVTKALHCKIEIYHLILDSIRKLADCNPYSGADLSWVKGDKKILASRQNALTGINELIFVNVETGASEFIVAPETSQSFYRFPRISPSGKLIAMLDSSSTGSYSKLVIYDIENVTLRHVNTHSHSVVHVGWGENDDELFYAEIAGKNTGLWRFDVEEQQHTLILNESVTEFDYDVTNDTFIVGVSRYATSIKRIQNGVESVVIDDDAFERHMQVSPNGKMLAYVSNRNGDDNIWMKSLDLNSLHRVTNDDVSDYVSLHFSNDNKFLAYLVMEDMRSVLVILDVKNSFQEVYRQVDVQSVAWSKDSQSIYTYGSNLEINTNELHQVSLPHFSKQFLTNTSELHRIETSGSQGLIVQPKAWGPIHKLCCLDKGYVDINQSSVLIDFEWIFKWDVIGDELSILKLENDYNLLNFYALNENENKTADLIIPEKKRVYFYDYNVATQSLYYVNFESEHNALLKLTKVIH